MRINVADTKKLVIFSIFEKETTETLKSMWQEKSNEIKEQRVALENNHSSSQVEVIAAIITKLEMEVEVLDKMIERRERSFAYDY